MARRAFALSIVLFAAAISLCPVTVSAQTEIRVAYVNSTLILPQTPGFGAADSTLNTIRAAFQQEADSMQAQLAFAVTGADQQQLALNPETGEVQMDSLQVLNDRIDARLAQMQNELQVRQRELLAPLQQRIIAVIDGIRAERDLAVVIDVANTSTGIVSLNPSLDLTDVVIARLQGDGSS